MGIWIIGCNAKSVDLIQIFECTYTNWLCVNLVCLVLAHADMLCFAKFSTISLTSSQEACLLDGQSGLLHTPFLRIPQQHSLQSSNIERGLPIANVPADLPFIPYPHLVSQLPLMPPQNEQTFPFLLPDPSQPPHGRQCVTGRGMSAGGICNDVFASVLFFCLAGCWPFFAIRLTSVTFIKTYTDPQEVSDASSHIYHKSREYFNI
jgi:hypothetical protein